jgi:hypothetical protein
MIIERYQGKILSTHKPATTNRLIACLKHMITKAVDWEMASEDTLRRIRKVKNLAESNKRTRFLNVNEVSKAHRVLRFPSQTHRHYGIKHGYEEGRDINLEVGTDRLATRVHHIG